MDITHGAKPMTTNQKIRALRRITTRAINDATESAHRDSAFDGGEWSTPAAHRAAEARIRRAVRQLGLDGNTIAQAMDPMIRAEAPHVDPRCATPDAYNDLSLIEEALS